MFIAVKDKYFHLLKKHNLFMFFLIVSISCSCTSYKKPSKNEFDSIKNISIFVKGAPEFSHIGAITEESFWMTMILGPYISTLGRNASDYNTARAINHKDISSAYRLQFIETLKNNINNESIGRFNSINIDHRIHNQPKNIDGIINLEIIDWGTRTRKPGSDIIFPFMEIKITMIRSIDDKKIWDESRIITNDTQHTLENYKQQIGLFDNDFKSLINKAAKQVILLLKS